jgi:hypothetical protein
MEIKIHIHYKRMVSSNNNSNTDPNINPNPETTTDTNVNADTDTEPIAELSLGTSLYLVAIAMRNITIIAGAKSVNAIINTIAKLTISSEDIENIEENDAVVKFRNNLNKMYLIVKDSESKEAIKNAIQSLGTIIEIFFTNLRKPLANSFGEIMNAVFDSYEQVLESGMESVVNIIRMIPIFGDGVIIMENLIKMVKAATATGSAALQTASSVSGALYEAGEKTADNEDFKKSTSELYESNKNIFDKFKTKFNEAKQKAAKNATELKDRINEQAKQLQDGDTKKFIERSKAKINEKKEKFREKVKKIRTSAKTAIKKNTNTARSAAAVIRSEANNITKNFRDKVAEEMERREEEKRRREERNLGLVSQHV